MIKTDFIVLKFISQASGSSDIRRAYRKLSLQLHPDKNKAEDAEIKFRQVSWYFSILTVMSIRGCDFIIHGIVLIITFPYHDKYSISALFNSFFHLLFQLVGIYEILKSSEKRERFVILLKLVTVVFLIIWMGFPS